jgi:hypothetical protein
LEQHTPPPRPRPGEGYAANCPALGVAPARRAAELIGAEVQSKGGAAWNARKGPGIGQETRASHARLGAKGRLNP